jgi:DnaJ-class molecular chaperone
MINYYELLNVSPIDDNKKIIKAYNIKMNEYYNRELTNDEKNKIKLFKKALYILTNANLKDKYNFLLYKYNTNLTSKVDNEPLPENDQDINNNLDNVFNVDTKWMESNEYLNNRQEDNKLDNNLINGRIFDLSKIYNREIKYDDMPVIQNTRDDK